MTYNASGELNVTMSNGIGYKGLYAPDGSTYITIATGPTFLGAYAPDGSLYVTAATSPSQGGYAPNGSLYITTDKGTYKNALLVSGFTGFDTSALAYFNALPNRETVQVKNLINTFISGLKTDGLWTILDGLNLQAVATQGNALVDLKVPSRVCTLYSTPTCVFTAYRGFAGTGSVDTTNLPDSINTGFIPSSAGGSMTLNSASLMVYRKMTGTTSTRSFAGCNGTSDFLILPRFTGDVTTGRANNSVTLNYGTTITDGNGFFLLSRTSVATTFSQWNTLQSANEATASVALADAPVRYLQIDSSSSAVSTESIALGAYGGAFSTAQGLLMNTRVQALMSTLLTL